MTNHPEVNQTQSHNTAGGNTTTPTDGLHQELRSTFEASELTGASRLRGAEGTAIAARQRTQQRSTVATIGGIAAIGVGVVLAFNPFSAPVQEIVFDDVDSSASPLAAADSSAPEVPELPESATDTNQSSIGQDRADENGAAGEVYDAEELPTEAPLNTTGPQAVPLKVTEVRQEVVENFFNWHSNPQTAYHKITNLISQVVVSDGVSYVVVGDGARAQAEAEASGADSWGSDDYTYIARFENQQWTRIDETSDLGVRDLMVKSDGSLVAIRGENATSFEMGVSTDGGQTWEWENVTIDVTPPTPTPPYEFKLTAQPPQVIPFDGGFVATTMLYWQLDPASVPSNVPIPEGAIVSQVDDAGTFTVGKQQSEAPAGPTFEIYAPWEEGNADEPKVLATVGPSEHGVTNLADLTGNESLIILDDGTQIVPNPPHTTLTEDDTWTEITHISASSAGIVSSKIGLPANFHEIDESDVAAKMNVEQFLSYDGSTWEPLTGVPDVITSQDGVLRLEGQGSQGKVSVDGGKTWTTPVYPAGSFSAQWGSPHAQRWLVTDEYEVVSFGSEVGPQHQIGVRNRDGNWALSSIIDGDSVGWVAVEDGKVYVQTDQHEEVGSVPNELSFDELENLEEQGSVTATMTIYLVE